MTIDIEKLDRLVADADKIFISPEGEEVLVSLLDIRNQVDLAIDEAKKILEESALKLNPNFTSLQADKVKVYFRTYGSKYKVDESHIKDLPEEYYDIKKSYSPKTEAIEGFVEKNGALPLGIIEPERVKTISFSLKGAKDE